MTEEGSESGVSEGGKGPESGKNEEVAEAPEFFGAPRDLANSGAPDPLQVVAKAVAQEENESIKETPTEATETETETGTEVEGEKKPPRTIVFKNGQEFPADTPIEVNGVEVTLGDLERDYIGQSEVQRRFTEFDKYKKQWEQDVVRRFEESEALTSSKLKKLNELAAKNDHLGVLATIAQFAGKDPVEFEQTMVSQALDLADKFTEMSEDEVKAHWAEKRAEHASAALKRREDKEAKTKSQAEQEAEIKQSINAYGLSEQQFSEAYTALKQDPEVMEVLKSLSPQEATSRVCNFYRDSIKEQRVIQALDGIAPKHPEKEKLVDMLFRVADYDYSVEDIKEIASKYLKTGTNGAVETPTTASTPSQKVETPERTPSDAKDYSGQEPEDVLGWDFTLALGE